IVPFSEKLKRNPNIARLFGAPDVWGDGTLRFAREAREAGVEKMIIHTSPSVRKRTGVTPADMREINKLGYLTSTYDNYTDIMQVEAGNAVDSTHDLLPDHAVLRADGQRMKAWLTWDKKQFMKRCPLFWVAAASIAVPEDLAFYPYLGRFIDVTTAEDLYECYDPKHALTRGGKRQCGVDLLSYVRSLKLVTGGEHGRWWAVPYLDYIEGMMSGGSYSWPAGYLTRPKSKDQQFTSPSGSKYAKFADYEKWGIGYQYRVPLWELVFHDCIISTWYWGDTNDFLLAAAPEVTPRKDAFNILYGTIPILWAGRQGSWETARDVFLRTYRNTCKLHEAIAGTEMISHEFVTPGRAVQRTKFSDGTQVIVNFGEKPYTAKLAGKSYVLPQNGFAVKGPRIEQSLALVNGRPVTTIRPASGN
ncbi:MAG: glycoside hydrolase, partial [Chloroflexi bacterium]|nr:glycoside hydrolase [Chloroflexota bacterium]